MKISILDMIKIHEIACNSWKTKISKYMSRLDDKQQITLTQNEVEEMFKAANQIQRTLLIEIFGDIQYPKVGDYVWSNNPNTEKENLGGEEGFVGILVEITDYHEYRIEFHSSKYPEYRGSKEDSNGMRYVWCYSNVRKATPEEIIEYNKPRINYTKLKTGSKVMIQYTGCHCGGIDNIDTTKPVDIVFYKTPHFIDWDGEFMMKGHHSKYTTFHQDGKYVLFSSDVDSNYILSVVSY